MAEDCGGSIVGWEDLKNAFKNLKRAGNGGLVEWYEDGCVNEDPAGILVTDSDSREAGFFEGRAL